VFFRKKRYSEVEGYDRISRMIEDRQSQEHSDQLEGASDEEVTVLLSRDAREAAAHQNQPGAQTQAPLTPPPGDDVEEAVETVTLVRPPERPQPQPAQQAWATSNTVTPAEPPVPAVAPEPVAAPARMSAPDLSFSNAQAGTASLVAKDAVWEGKLVCAGNVRIDGTLLGEVETNGTLFVAAEAKVDGSVRARNVTLAGEIKGDLRCEERLEILPGGAARGDVDTGALVVHEGAFIESRFQMRRDAAPAR
jgi:cytoskeletal protein CcmA (bactofilin family)